MDKALRLLAGYKLKSTGHPPLTTLFHKGTYYKDSKESEHG